VLSGDRPEDLGGLATTVATTGWWLFRLKQRVGRPRSTPYSRIHARRIEGLPQVAAVSPRRRVTGAPRAFVVTPEASRS